MDFEIFFRVRIFMEAMELWDIARSTDCGVLAKDLDFIIGDIDTEFYGIMLTFMSREFRRRMLHFIAIESWNIQQEYIRALKSGIEVLSTECR
jgi:hypothetical protein